MRHLCHSLPILSTQYLGQTIKYRREGLFQLLLTCIWNLCWTRDFQNIFDVIQIWRKTSMYTEYFIIDQSSNWHIIKHISKQFPYFQIISSFTFYFNHMLYIHRKSHRACLRTLTRGFLLKGKSFLDT